MYAQTSSNDVQDDKHPLEIGMVLDAEAAEFDEAAQASGESSVKTSMPPILT